MSFIHTILVSTLVDRHGPYVPALLVGRLADTATTLYGLSVTGIYERNPLVAELIELLGPAGGMFVANLVTIAVVVGVVELAVATVRPNGNDGLEWPFSERFVLEVGYLPAVVLSFGAAVHNVGLIATV